MSNIFVITTVDLRALPPYGGKKNYNPRCVGFQYNLEDAITLVEGNYGDIHEYSFDYCVIEETCEGLYPHIPNEYWFKFNSDIRKYEPCDKPEEGITGYGIG